MDERPTSPPARGWVDAERGLVSREAFVSDEVFRLEMARIFDRGWNFLAHDSEIPADLQSQERIYDFIRMLDCEGYPAAFVERNGFRFELRNSRLDAGRLEAGVTIIPREEKP